MLSFLTLITVFISICTGITVLARGDWRKFMLKFAGVALSTSASICMAIILIMHKGNYGCDNESASCMSWYLYSIMRNVAFILFHISVGRDARRFKLCDRRKPPAFSPSCKIPERSVRANGR